MMPAAWTRDRVSSSASTVGASSDQDATDRPGKGCPSTSPMTMKLRDPSSPSSSSRTTPGTRRTRRAATSLTSRARCFSESTVRTLMATSRDSSSSRAR